jgi:hypothetical protein
MDHLCVASCADKEHAPPATRNPDLDNTLRVSRLHDAAPLVLALLVRAEWPDVSNSLQKSPECGHFPVNQA